MKFKVGEKAKLEAKGLDTLTTLGFKDGQIVEIIDIDETRILERYKIKNKQGIVGFANAESLLKKGEKRHKKDELKEAMTKYLREKALEELDLKVDLERLENPKKKRKFKCGDIVRVTDEGSHCFEVGDIVKVIKIEKSGNPPIKCVRVNRSELDDMSNDIWWVFPEEIELI